MDPENIPNDKAQQSQAADSAGLAGSTPSKARGRPRKQAAGSDGFHLPARPEVEQTEKQDGRKFIVLPFRVYHDKEITRQALRVLVMLAAHANRNGFLWCGMQRIADDLGVTQEAVSQQVVKLKQAGYIEETAKPYYGGPTARTATLRIIYDPTMSAEDVISRDSRSDDLLPNIQESNEAITSLNDKVVDSVEARQPTKADLQRLLPSLIAEVQARYRSEGLPVPVGDRLAREVADLTSAKQRSGTLLA
jgi:biotin operon repressor